MPEVATSGRAKHEGCNNEANCPARSNGLPLLLYSEGDVPALIYMSFNHSRRVAERCRVLVIKRVSTTKCLFELHPNSSRKVAGRAVGGCLSGNKHDYKQTPLQQLRRQEGSFEMTLAGNKAPVLLQLSVIEERLTFPFARVKVRRWHV